MQSNLDTFSEHAHESYKQQCSADPVVLYCAKVREMAEECVVFTQLWFYGGNALCV